MGCAFFLALPGLCPARFLLGFRFNWIFKTSRVTDTSYRGSQCPHRTCVPVASI